MIACGVGMTAFGVFGLGKTISEASTFAPSDRAHRAASCCGRNRFSRNPSSDGFLCSSEHSKVCIELLDTFRVTPENLALAGGGAVPPKSGSPDLEPAVGKGVVAYVAQPLNPHKYER